MRIDEAQVGWDLRRLRTPGVYFDELPPGGGIGVPTGQPVFFGFAVPPPSTDDRPRPEPDAGPDRLRAVWLTAAEQFGETVGTSPPPSFLAAAVQGFFENGGRRCLVLASNPRADADDSWWDGIVDRWLEQFDGVEGADESIDLVCAPDLPSDPDRRMLLQQRLLAYCDRVRRRFAILDASPEGNRTDTASQWHTLVSPNGALYYPWLKPARGALAWVPPCGHVAGVYAAMDRRVGPHKAPANVALADVVDVADPLDDRAQGELNAVGVNCLRVLPGRGIRVWGARTLSGRADWRYVNVRRLFITVERRVEYECRDLVFESNDRALWARLGERLNDYCYRLYQRGALQGATPGEAYYVKCDEETNPPAARDVGIVTAELGLAPNMPAEFVVVRMTYHVGGGTPLSP